MIVLTKQNKNTKYDAFGFLFIFYCGNFIFQTHYEMVNLLSHVLLIVVF